MTKTTQLRRCIGSERFGIEAHEAPVADFPKQPSQKDGMGRMCRPHWNQYTAGLARERKARLAAEGGAPTPKPAASVRKGRAAKPAAAKAPTKRERRRSSMSNVPVTEAELLVPTADANAARLEEAAAERRAANEVTSAT